MCLVHLYDLVLSEELFFESNNGVEALGDSYFLDCFMHLCTCVQPLSYHFSRHLTHIHRMSIDDLGRNTKNSNIQNLCSFSKWSNYKHKASQAQSTARNKKHITKGTLCMVSACTDWICRASLGAKGSGVKTCGPQARPLQF